MGSRWRNLWFATVGVLGVSAAMADVRMVGSDLLGIEFSKALYEFAATQKLGIALAFDGSRPGVQELNAGHADILLVVLPPDEDVAIEARPRFTLGYYPTVVLAAASCPLAQITLEQLALIFGPTDRMPRWSDLGAAGEGSASTVAGIVPEAGSGIALEYFRHVVLKGGPLRPGLARFSNATELDAKLAADPRTIAIAGQTPRDAKNTKALAFATQPGGPAVLPTAENLHAGKYPLSLRLNIVLAGEPNPATRPVLRFLFSEAATALIERAGGTPLPAADRAQQRLAFADD